MDERKRKNILIIILCCMLVFMGIGYSILSQTLVIHGSGRVMGDWNIEITSIEVSNSGLAKTPTAISISALVDQNDSTKASFSAQLLQPGDYITYDVKVKNNGTIDALLNGVTLVPINNDFITFSTTANEFLNITLVPQQEITFTVTARFPRKPNGNDIMPTNDDDKHLTATLTLDYVQASVADISQIGGQSGD